MKKKRKVLVWIVLGTVFLAVYNVRLNQTFDITSCLVVSPKIPAEFNGYTIVQISDFHSLEEEAFRGKLLDAVRQESPDIIVITGDLVDAGIYAKEAADLAAGSREGLPGASAADFTKTLTKIAPVYYIYGNHEMILLDDPENNLFKVSLEEMGVQILNNSLVLLERDDASIQLAGIQDPATLYKDPMLADSGQNTRERTEAMLEYLSPAIDPGCFTVLLAHRPEYVDVYARYPVDLVLAGHAHGGQIRLPLMREGLYAPNQGVFPRYTNGSYKVGSLEMIVSRGLGNSVIPVRFLNSPELVVIKLTNNGNDDTM